MKCKMDDHAFFFIYKQVVVHKIVHVLMIKYCTCFTSESKEREQNYSKFNILVLNNAKKSKIDDDFFFKSEMDGIFSLHKRICKYFKYFNS